MLSRSWPAAGRASRRAAQQPSSASRNRPSLGCPTILGSPTQATPPASHPPGVPAQAHLLPAAPSAAPPHCAPRWPPASAKAHGRAAPRPPPASLQVQAHIKWRRLTLSGGKGGAATPSIGQPPRPATGYIPRKLPHAVHSQRAGRLSSHCASAARRAPSRSSAAMRAGSSGQRACSASWAAHT